MRLRRSSLDRDEVEDLTLEEYVDSWRAQLTATEVPMAKPDPPKDEPVRIWGEKGLFFCMWIQRNFDALIEEASSREWFEEMEERRKLGL